MARTLLKTFKPDNPVGSVIHSMLTEAQFQAEHGSDWVLADGRSVVGSKYETITGEANIPDMRGQFLRGKNNGRNDGNEDPAGERAVGAYQADKVKSHRHRTVSSYAGTYGGYSISGTRGVFAVNATNGTADYTAIDGDGESAPKNITINYFIKIN